MANENKRNESSGSSRDDLKAREYRGEDGQIHHHTKEYMERHGKSAGSDRSGREEDRSERDGGDEEDRGRGSGER